MVNKKLFPTFLLIQLCTVVNSCFYVVSMPPKLLKKEKKEVLQLLSQRLLDPRVSTED